MHSLTSVGNYLKPVLSSTCFLCISADKRLEEQEGNVDKILIAYKI